MASSTARFEYRKVLHFVILLRSCGENTLSLNRARTTPVRKNNFQSVVRQENVYLIGKMRSCYSNMNQTTAVTRNYLIMNADGKDIIDILMKTMELCEIWNLYPWYPVSFPLTLPLYECLMLLLRFISTGVRCIDLHGYKE